MTDKETFTPTFKRTNSKISNTYNLYRPIQLYYVLLYLYFSRDKTITLNIAGH